LVVHKIKAKVKTLHILYIADDDLPKIVETDASNYGWGAVLKQLRQKKEEIIQFASSTWEKAELHYSTLDKEVKATLNAIHKFEIFLINKRFLLHTDVAAMKKVLTKDIKHASEAKFAQWQALSCSTYPLFCPIAASCLMGLTRRSGVELLAKFIRTSSKPQISNDIDREMNFVELILFMKSRMALRIQTLNLQTIYCASALRQSNQIDSMTEDLTMAMNGFLSQSSILPCIALISLNQAITRTDTDTHGAAKVSIHGRDKPKQPQCVFD